MADQPFLASNSFDGDGTNTDWEFSWEGLSPDSAPGAVPYISTEDIHCEEMTPAGDDQVVVQKEFTLLTPTKVRVTPATPVGTILRVYRVTENRFPLVDYNELQVVSEADLDLANRQAVYIVQEARDAARGAGNIQAEAIAIAVGAALDAAESAAEAAASVADAPERLDALEAFDLNLLTSAGSGLGFDWQVNYAPSTIGATFREFRNIRRYGDVADDGVTNDIAAFQAAAASGPGIIDARGLLNCRLNGTITVGTGQTWLLEGSTFVTANDDEPVFFLSVISNVSLMGPFYATGTGGATFTGASFIRINDCIDWCISKPRIYNMPGYGIYHTPGGGTSDRAKHGTIEQPYIRGCNIGILDVAGTGAEYYTILDPHITFCHNTGLVTAAGNVIVLGGHIVDNLMDGVRISSGANHAHGGFYCVNINHNNRYNLYCNHIVNGETFVGCHFYGNNAGLDGQIFLDHCRGIRFHGGHLACWIYNYEAGAGAGLNYVEDMFCLGSYGEVKLLDDLGNRPKNLIIRDCYGPGASVAGITINDPSPMYVYALRQPGANQALSGATVLLFPVEQAHSDRRQAYNPATGITTIPALMEGGQYRIGANLYFTATSGLTDQSSYVQVRVNGVPRRLFTAHAFSGTIMTCVVNCDIFLNPGDTVDFQASIVGTGVLFGGATLESAMSIERIA